MQYFVFLFLALSVLTGSTAFANGEYIGPAYRAEGGACGVVGFNPPYEYWGKSWTQYSNGATGHATYKCKMELTLGDPQISYSEFAAGSFPLEGDAVCYITTELEGQKGTWTAQCFNAWESGD